MAHRIPQDFIDQLLSRVDIVEIIDAHLSLRKTGREYSACCPFHTEKTPSFTVSPTKQFYHCFGCGAHGNVISFLMEYEHMEFADAVEELARSVGLELPRGITMHQDNHGDLIAVMEQANHFFRQQLRQHPGRHRVIGYLQNRGLTGEIANTFGMGFAPPTWDGLLSALTAKGIALKDLIRTGLVIEQDNGNRYDRFRDRLTFPIRDRRGRTIAFGARTLGEAKPKYLNSPETPFFHKGRELYGLYEARISSHRLRRIVVVEGYMDVVALAQHGIRYAVATLGTATTPDHLERLFRIVADVVFCFDGDRAGREAAWRALENTLPLLRDDRRVSFLFLPEGEDPDSLIRKEGQQTFEQRLLQATTLSDYFFERLSADRDMNSIDGRARLVEQAIPLVNKLPDSVYRDMLIQRLEEIDRTSRINKVSLQARLNMSAVSISNSRRETNPARTPVRLAIALLLNRTELAQQANDIKCFQGIDVPGLTLLMELVELIQTNPHMNVGALLERYRGTNTGRILECLAQWQPEIPENLIAAEFLGILEKLKKLYVEKQLFDKIARGKLKLEDSETLRNPDKRPQ
jgi:DNA primase